MGYKVCVRDKELQDEFEKFVTSLKLPFNANAIIEDEDDMGTQENLSVALAKVERQKNRRFEERSRYEKHIKSLEDRLSAVMRNTTGEVAGASVESVGMQTLEPLSDVLSNLGRALEGLNQTIAMQNNHETPSVMFADPSRLVREFQGKETPEQARAWFNEFENISRIHSWNNTVTVSDKLKVMLAREQSFRETIQEYVLDKIWLCTELNLTVEEIKDEVAAGLWSKDAANHLLGRNIASTDYILKEILHFDQLESTRRQRINDKKKETYLHENQLLVI